MFALHCRHSEVLSELLSKCTVHVNFWKNHLTRKVTYERPNKSQRESILHLLKRLKTRQPRLTSKVIYRGRFDLIIAIGAVTWVTYLSLSQRFLRNWRLPRAFSSTSFSCHYLVILWHHFFQWFEVARGTLKEKKEWAFWTFTLPEIQTTKRHSALSAEHEYYQKMFA